MFNHTEATSKVLWYWLIGTIAKNLGTWMVSSAFGIMLITQCCVISSGKVRAHAYQHGFLIYHSWLLTFINQNFTKSIGHHGGDIIYKEIKHKLNMLAYKWLQGTSRFLAQGGADAPPLASPRGAF